MADQAHEKSVNVAAPYLEAVNSIDGALPSGRLTAIHGLVMEATGCSVRKGELVEVVQDTNGEIVLAEVIGLRDERIMLMPFREPVGMCLNSRVVPLNRVLNVPVGTGLLGRVIDPLGQAFDEHGTTDSLQTSACAGQPINPMHRLPIEDRMDTGVRAIDAFMPLGHGQRMGIMAGSGVGKSTLIGMIAGHADVDVIVIALVGERGREVGEFIRQSLKEEGLKRAVVVVASADQPAVMRRQTAFTATTVAEWFRNQGEHVLLIMDSVTRFAMAQREIGMSTGEALGARGYPASVFSMLPPLVERAGIIAGGGSITAIYTVLVESDDMNEPITDYMRSLLDGHIILSRALSVKGHFPAIDVLNSTSRLANILQTKEQSRALGRLRSLLAAYSASKDFIELGAYEAGTNAELDRAIEAKDRIDDFLQQELGESFGSDDTFEKLSKLSGALAA